MADQPEGNQPNRPLPTGATPEPPAGPTPPTPDTPPATPPPAAEEPAAEQPAGPPYVPPPAGAASSAPGGGFGRFARNKATQLVAVGVIGLVLGGGLVALSDRDGHRPGDRPGLSRMDDRHPGGREFRDFPR
ncbi:hypothetical protein ABZ816_17370 [Actinosynnema sp. NPDC047251]|uniref:Putative membrane protein n=1 Tax=Saccharothrix espanaensis (strain ATCC 51144 / DSM 44229 / JCM 9112 / NBRC 15066 / NRRL 15764) TaxID=1179773 RepID=K0K0A9_SACES|nr:hypothetical protein [Saccharothrix espanaensis]CCH30334.1 putative membrane protein [Saccharothrix espanaensis DSM 44229]